MATEMVSLVKMTLDSSGATAKIEKAVVKAYDGLNQRVLMTR